MIVTIARVTDFDQFLKTFLHDRCREAQAARMHERLCRP
jgi:hypothetical protein